MRDSYESPLASRYTGREMLYLFSPDNKFRTWRGLWIALAKAEKELGLPITQSQIDELERYKNDINHGDAERFEKELRHDVMAHIQAYGLQCPEARPIIHLGATSCYVGDNTDIIIMRDSLKIIEGGIIGVIARLKEFALKYKDLPALGFTHFQPAQPVTVGKRACLWINDLLMDLEELRHRLKVLAPLGCKGTTGTQASFLELFGGDYGKVKRLDELVCAEMGFERSVPVSGQTYSRKADYYYLAVLSGIAQSAGKFATDMRLLSHLKELEEPAEPGQVGSSAMPYKRNPMRSERICALSRAVMTAAQNPAITAASQWLERTLDDSANRRLVIPEAALATDAVLRLYANIAGGIIVNDKMILKHLSEELPFMAAENILMDAVLRGGDRQTLHERIRVHAVDAGHAVKREGRPNDLAARIAGDPAFGMTLEQIEAGLEPGGFVGCAPAQVEGFIENCVEPVLAGFDLSGGEPELKV